MLIEALIFKKVILLLDCVKQVSLFECESGRVLETGVESENLIDL